MTIIEKTLNRDKERVIQSALRVMYKDSDFYPYVFEIDSDKSEVYYEMYMDEGYKVFMLKYTMNADNTSATLSGEPVEVVSQTEYKTVSKSFVEEVVAAIAKYFGGMNKAAPNIEDIPVIKQFDEEQMVAIEPLYIAPGETDGHGWTASAEVLRDMTESCNKAIQEGRLLSKYNHTEVTNDFHFVKAWVNECDCYIGNHYVPEGQPMIKSQFTNKDAWEKRKAGDICGVSIGCKGVWENIEE